MTRVELNFTQRFKLTQLLSVQEGNIGKTAPFFRILELVRFTDEEDQKIVHTHVGINQVQFDPPKDADGEPIEGWGDLAIEIDTSDATQLTELLKTYPQFKTVDHLWVGPVLKQLDSNTPVLVKKRKGA